MMKVLKARDELVYQPALLSTVRAAFFQILEEYSREVFLP